MNLCVPCVLFGSKIPFQCPPQAAFNDFQCFILRAFARDCGRNELRPSLQADAKRSARLRKIGPKELLSFLGVSDFGREKSLENSKTPKLPLDPSKNKCCFRPVFFADVFVGKASTMHHIAFAFPSRPRPKIQSRQQAFVS
jgi:hypothetical protein